MRGAIDFPLKGERSYVHSTDMLDGSVAWLRARCPGARLENLDLVIHRLLRSGADCVLTPRAAYERSDADCAVLAADVDGDARALALRESGRALTLRRAYPEEEVVGRCAFDLPGARVQLGSLAGFTFVEAVTAMNKALLTRLFPAAGGKWLSTRVRLGAPVDGTALEEVEVALTANLRFKLTRSRLRHRGADVGELYFSLA